MLGAGFGMLMRVNGYGLLIAVLMSVMIYAGSAQYVGIGLITSGASFTSDFRVIILILVMAGVTMAIRFLHSENLPKKIFKNMKKTVAFFARLW